MGAIEHPPIVHLPWSWTPDQVTYTWLVMIILVGLAYLGSRNMQLVPHGIQNFLEVVLEHWPLVLLERGKVDSAAARNERLARQCSSVVHLYGERPVIAAGSTGSIPATADLLRAIAGLERGSLVLPGLDTSFSPEQHELMISGQLTQGHPQFGLMKLLRHLGAAVSEVIELAGENARTALVRAALAPANARLELARAIAAIAAPAIVGLLAQHRIGVWAYGLAAACALASALLLARLPEVPRAATVQGRGSLPAAIRAGAAFVLGHPVLRAIALCAVFWNFAFFVLAAAFIPFALGRLGLDAAAAGITQAAYGAGALLAGATGGWIVANRPTNWTLLFGPAVSVAAGVLILAGLLVRDATLPGTAVPLATLPAAAGYFLIGFGPVLWLICQTTVRQLLTPADMLGRVTATIQTAIYGVRPLGALAGGWIAARYGLDAAILLATLAFTASLAVVLLSPLVALVRLPVPAE